MALPIIPIALAAGAVAAARAIKVSPAIQSVEDTLDTVEEGFSARRSGANDQLNGAYRWRRIVRIGANGPGIEIDAAALGRLKFRKID